MEEQGVMLPVLTYQIKYFKPAFFDDEAAFLGDEQIFGLYLRRQNSGRVSQPAMNDQLLVSDAKRYFGFGN